MLSALPRRFNRSMQHDSSVGRCFKARGLAWALVEPHGNLVQVRLRERERTVPLGEYVAETR